MVARVPTDRPTPPDRGLLTAAGLPSVPEAALRPQALVIAAPTPGMDLQPGVRVPQGLATPAAGVSPRATATGEQNAEARAVATLRAGFEALGPRGTNAVVRHYDKNVESWAARWWLMENSTSDHFDATYYIWAKDIFGYAMLGNLLEKAREGKKVRVMVDATGDGSGDGFKKTGDGADYLQELVNTGNAQVRVYHPWYKKVVRQVFHPTSTMGLACNHDKILTDGQWSVTGGRNMWANSMADPRDGEVVDRDADVIIRSRKTAEALSQAFEIEFNLEHNHVIGPDLLGNWKKRDVVLMGAYLMMDHWMKAPALSSRAQEALRNDASLREVYADDLVRRALAGLPAVGIERSVSGSDRKELRALALELAGYPATRGSGRGFSPNDGAVRGDVAILDTTSSGNGHIGDMNEALISLSKHAQKRIVIQNPYVVLSESAIEALAEAGRRGVEIIIGTNGPEASNTTVTQAFFLEQWPNYLARIPNSRIIVARGNRMIHSKTAVFDDHVTLVSTFNLDFLSMYVNSEVLAAVWSKDLAKDMIDSYLEDQANPENKAFEYTIERREDGTPVLTENGAPIVANGPEAQMTEDERQSYARKRKLWKTLSKVLPQLEPLRVDRVDPSDLQPSGR